MLRVSDTVHDHESKDVGMFTLRKKELTVDLIRSCLGYDCLMLFYRRAPLCGLEYAQLLGISSMDAVPEDICLSEWPSGAALYG